MRFYNPICIKGGPLVDTDLKGILIEICRNPAFTKR